MIDLTTSSNQKKKQAENDHIDLIIGILAVLSVLIMVIVFIPEGI